MMQWIEKGYDLSGTRTVGTYIASRNGKHAVLRSDFWGTLNVETEWFPSIEQAQRETMLVTAYNAS